MTISKTTILCLTLLQLIVLVSPIRPSSDSILEMINTKEVERIIAERQNNKTLEEKKYLKENELDYNYVPTDVEDYEYQRVNLVENEPEVQVKPQENHRIEVELLMRRQNITDPYRSTDLLNDLRGYKGSKVLKSSRNALVVTKKEYLQRDWCKTEPLVQKIKEEGCLTRTIINKFCYGQCNSFYIPKNPKRRHSRKKLLEESEDVDLNGAAFTSCSVCRPKKFTWITVMLRCPGLTQQFKKKKIQRVKLCKCIASDAN